ncbi:MAG: DegT/DnrJ/EryC1/StrS family aminotransferase, partial [Bacteroidota bacterium]
MRKSFLVFGSPKIDEDEIQEVVDSLRTAWIGTGPKVAKFEELFRDYLGAQYAVAVHSCTAALHLSLIASDVKAGDEVITSPMTFAATANAVIHTGATPVFADINVASLNIDPAEIKKRLTPSTKVILPVHFAGRACDMA